MGKLDELEGLIPQDMIDAAKDLIAEEFPPIQPARRESRREAEMRRLRNRNLNAEVTAIHEFVASGMGKAAVTVPSERAAKALRARLYFAVAQERARVNDIQDTEEHLRELDRIRPLDNLSFLVAQVEDQWKIIFEYRLEIKLESIEG